MADKFDPKFEKNDLSDSHERVDKNLEVQKNTIDEKIDQLDAIVERNIADIDSLEIDEEIADLKDSITQSLQHPENLSERIHTIKDEKRVVTKIDKKFTSSALTPDIQKTIEHNSEDPMSIVGRQESFQNVQSFSDIV